MKNSIEVIRPFAKALENSPSVDVQIIGGINSVALVHLDTVIDFDAKEVIAPADLYLPTIRDDKTRTLRDLDVFVKSSEPSDIAYIKGMLDGTVGTELDQSIFGIRPSDPLERQLARPLGIAAFKTFLSDRYQVSDDVELPPGMVSKDHMVKSLFPFAVPLDKESLETWTLSVGDMHTPIPNPAMSIINYTTRSIAGVRPKDADKIGKMADSVLEKAPELRDWALDGPGKAQVELGLLLRGLTPKKLHVDYFSTGKPILTKPELVENESFMLPNIRTTEKCRILGRAVTKARLLNFGESNPLVVSVWQKIVEKRIGSIVNNE